MDSALPVRRSWWRFSLRELLLVMVAVAAFLGWGGLLYQQSRPFEPTPFFANKHTWQDDVISVYEELGGIELGRPKGRSIESRGTAAVSRTMMYYIPLLPAKQASFFDAFVKRIQETMAEEGCRTGSNGSGSDGRGRSRILMYERGPVSGVIEIWMTDAGSDACLMVQMREAKGRFHSLTISGQ